MQRWAIIGIILCLAAIAGCTSTASEEGYTVMFDDMPRLYDDQIYFMGEKVGTVLSRAKGQQGAIVKMTVFLEEAFAEKMGTNIAFFPKYGRLEIEKLEAVGKPLVKETLLSGFASKGGLNWFKLKTLMSNRVTAAEKRARTLFDRFTASS